ncbi:U4/U6.U5 tri-snRNP-associated 1 [Gossypium arboreum]|uniref:U4/U6.U5 tri-snRNP-associated 1 n=1 Tax=Gossypium arboreum TaxID=29729 RepID=A0A0B0PND3_GOSAR|nr:U4/U6.U5 tri-snRNP-associated 1 [Gossypium arboreum]
MEKDRYDREDDASRERRLGGAYSDELEQTEKHRSKDKKKSSREEEKDHRNRDRERDRSKRSSDEILKEREKDSLEKDRVSTRERRKDDRDEHGKDRAKDSKVREKEKDYDRDKHREKEHEREREKDRKDRGKDKDRERDRESEKERGKDKSRDRDREKEKERDKAKEREKERDKLKDREKEREGEKDRDREKGKDRSKQKNRETDLEKERSRDRDNVVKNHEEDYEGSKDGELALDYEDRRDKDEAELNAGSNASLVQASSSELEERIVRMKEVRLKKKSEGLSEVSAWVSRSRKLEDKRNAEKEKALQLSKIFEEQDNFVQGEDEDEEADNRPSHDLGGVKVLHGLDKVMDGGAVVLTLKDQSILADGDLNEDVDMLENIEIGEQKQRDEAYKAAKKKTGVYDDKFNEDPGSEKKILPQYDDPVADEGVTLDERGRFTGEAEKKLDELRKRLLGVPTNNRVEDLNNVGKVSSDYYTQEEMLRFKKPKKKKALRKKEKLDIDALEAEAVSAGLGAGDLGSRNDSRRQAIKEEEARSEAEKRNNAYQAAFAKADEASKSLRLEQTLTVKPEEDENQVFADDEEDLYKSLEKARRLALKKQEEKSGPQAVALLAATSASNQTTDDQNTSTGEAQENKVVITEMEEFVWGLQLDEATKSSAKIWNIFSFMGSCVRLMLIWSSEAHKPDSEDVFMDEDEVPGASEQDRENGENEVGGWTEVVDTSADEKPANEDNNEVVPDETIHEIAVGKGLSGALKLLKDRGTLKETIEWGGRNMDKKKSKLVGIVDDDHQTDNRFKDIRIERTDEFGRIVTPKEAFRMLSHKFHGKGPGKMKQEKRMKQYQEELKLKQMKNSDTPSLSVERMREAQAQLKTPYLVLSGHVKPGYRDLTLCKMKLGLPFYAMQTSDPASGFATVEKDFPGGLTPMLGDRKAMKVEHFLGIKRKAEAGNSGTPKKPKT